MGEGIIVYIDEQEDQRSQFRSDALISDKFEEIIKLAPLPDIRHMIEEIISNGAEAVVVDFKLAANMPEISYDGAELVNELHKCRRHLPIYIFTSYAGDAMPEAFDANTVYIKADEAQKDRLFTVAHLQIKKNRAKIAELEEKILSLRSRRQKLSPTEEEDYLHLNNKLEAYIGKTDNSDEIEMLKSDREKARTNLIESAEEILRQLRTKLNSED